MSVLSLLNDRCTIRRKTLVDSAATGAPRAVWADLYFDVPCTCQFDTGNETRKLMGEDGSRTATVYFPAGTDVVTGDRLKGFTLGPQKDITMSVTSPPIDGSGRQAYLEVTCQWSSGVTGDGR